LVVTIVPGILRDNRCGGSGTSLSPNISQLSSPRFELDHVPYCVYASGCTAHVSGYARRRNSAAVTGTDTLFDADMNTSRTTIGVREKLLPPRRSGFLIGRAAGV